MSDPRFFPPFPPGFGPFPPGVPQGLRPPSNPVFGQQWLDWWWDGIAWRFGTSPFQPGAPGPGPGAIIPPGFLVVPLNQIPIYNSTQYVPNSRLVRLLVEIKGGGGPGSGVQVSTGSAIVAASGSSGAFTRALFNASDVGAGINVTIGQGGISVAGGAPGTPGGTTSFGTLLSAPGGLPANDVTGAPSAPGMANPPIGAIAMPGDPGANGYVLAIAADPWAGASGAGGAGVYGGGAPGVFNATPGSTVAGANGQNGGGGSGAVGINAPGTAPGGNGGNGWCFLTEYVLVDIRTLMAVQQSAQSAAAQAQIAAQPEPPALAAVSGGSF